MEDVEGRSVATVLLIAYAPPAPTVQVCDICHLPDTLTLLDWKAPVRPLPAVTTRLKLAAKLV